MPRMNGGTPTPVMKRLINLLLILPVVFCPACVITIQTRDSSLAPSTYNNGQSQPVNFNNAPVAAPYNSIQMPKIEYVGVYSLGANGSAMEPPLNLNLRPKADPFFGLNLLPIDMPELDTFDFGALDVGHIGKPAQIARPPIEPMKGLMVSPLDPVLFPPDLTHPGVVLPNLRVEPGYQPRPYSSNGPI